jgi:DNA-binding NarL/FixJ family response regulator
MPVDTLIIEDSDTFRRILGAWLERLGLKIVGEARSATEGLELFHAHNPSLVTLDLVMPGFEHLSASDLFFTMRQESPGTAIVVISAHPRNSNARHFLAAGAVAYMEKNFMSFDQLAVTLKSVFPGLMGHRQIAASVM